MTITLADMAPAQVTPDGGAVTTLAIQSATIDRAILDQAIRHSGGRFPQTTLHPGGSPTVTLTMPARQALDTFGVGLTKLTDLKVWLALFSDGELASGAAHQNIQAATGGFAVIDSIQAGSNGLALATVRIVPIAADDLSSPWTLNSSQTLPTLSAQPVLNTLGAIAIGGTAKDGLQSVNVGFNHQLQPLQGIDGRRYSTEVRYGGSSPVITGQTIGRDLQTDLGFEGAQQTDVDLYFRENDEANATLKTTGIELACNDAFFKLDNDNFSQDTATGLGFTVRCLETDNTTTPIIYTASATVP